MSGAWDDFYRFWVTQQTLPGNIFGDVLIGAGAFVIGKFKIAPWIEARHKEHLEQKERQHRELLASHRELIDSHRDLLESHKRMIHLQERQLAASGGDDADADGKASTR